MMSANLNILRSGAFPEQLRALRSKPEILWYSGNADLLNLPMVSVVGSRKVSKEGIARTQRVTRTLVSHGICVVSGLAEGVDAAAHITALKEHGATVAVMGTPIDECYPTTHIELKRDIEIHGLVLSQFDPGSEIQRGNFPRRNELMASLCIMTIVVEAGVNSGTRHQVKSAIALGRVVGFLPSLMGRGFPWVEEAMNSGRGFVISSPKDLIKQLEILRGKKFELVAPAKEDQLILAVEEAVSKPVITKSAQNISPVETASVSVQIASKEPVVPVIETAKELPKSVQRRSWLAPITKCWTWIIIQFKKLF